MPGPALVSQAPPPIGKGVPHPLSFFRAPPLAPPGRPVALLPCFLLGSVANLRCVVRPEWTPLVEIPYTHALPKGGRVVHGEVTDIRDGQVCVTVPVPVSSAAAERADGAAHPPACTWLCLALCAWQVFLRAGEPIPYDFVVIATGASMRAPGKLPSIETGASREYFARTRQQIEAANQALCVARGALTRGPAPRNLVTVGNISRPQRNSLFE
jgi:hypothetical protein